MDLEPYGPLREVAPALYCIDGAWRGSPFGRRMTIVRHSRDELLIHSAIRLSDADYARVLDPLGRVSLIVVPNRLHGDEARFHAERYPGAAVLVPQPVRDACARKLPRVDGTVGEDWPRSWAGEVHAVQVEGTRIGEALLWHVPSRTLVATDLVFHFTDELSGLARILMRWNGVVGRVGPSRIFRWFFVTDRRALVASLEPVRGWEFERIVMSHGTIVERDGKRLFLDGFARLAP
jgi:hypothetical protein